MTMEKTMTGTACTIALAGRLDTTTAPQLEKEFRAIAPDISQLTLDFSQLEYLSSAGLRVLLSAQKEMSKKDGLVIKNVNETIMEVFEVTGFSDILTIE